MADKQGKQPGTNTYSRRQFLLNTAKLAGAVAAYPLLSSPEKAAASTHAPGKSTGASLAGEARVGILLPQSPYYTNLAPGFMAGMSYFLGQASSHNITIVTADTGFGAENIHQKVAMMLERDQVDMLVGLVTPGVAASVRYLIEASNTPFVVSSLGENVPRTNEVSSNIFYHTLGLWQANWALGRWAASQIGTTAVLASSAIDSGYDAVYAFQAGYESAGGRVVANPITHGPNGSNGFEGVLTAVRDNKPAVVFGGYYGQLAVDFLNFYADAGLAGVVPLVGTAYLTEQKVLQTTSRASGVKTALAWSTALATPENLAFMAGYRLATGQTADAFALLGYEAAQIISSAADIAATNRWSMLEALGAVRFSGPRGTISMDNRTHSTTGSLYLQEVQQQGKAIQNAVLETLKSSAEESPAVADLRASVKTGLLNTYLCA